MFCQHAAFSWGGEWWDGFNVNSAYRLSTKPDSRKEKQILMDTHTFITCVTTHEENIKKKPVTPYKYGVFSKNKLLISLFALTPADNVLFVTEACTDQRGVLTNHAQIFILSYLISYSALWSFLHLAASAPSPCEPLPLHSLIHYLNVQFKGTICLLFIKLMSV